MKKAVLAARVPDRVHLTDRQAKTIVDILSRCITEALRERDKVELQGFGSFQTRSRDARQGRNPATGDAVKVPARKAPFSRTAQKLWERVQRLQPGSYIATDIPPANCHGPSGGLSPATPRASLRH